MTERERLIELCDTNNGWVNEVPAEDFADYLLENGVIVPPCKVGDMVFAIINSNIIEINIETIHCWSNGVWKCNGWYGKSKYGKGYELSFEGFGKTIFLTREEAEKALKEEQNHD